VVCRLQTVCGGVLVGMETHLLLSGKIVVGSHGLGVPDAELVQRRAWEVAQIESHEAPTSADWEEARRELHGRLSSTEMTETLRPIAVPELNSVVLRDEITLGEELVREGMEEAEHERMLLARRDDSGR
jgi:hypothetical protein